MYYIVAGIIVVALTIAGAFILRGGISDTTQSVEVQNTEETPFTGVEHRITLTEEGYEPSVITIAVGDKITFGTDATYSKLHWPASNVHPTHSIYPAFDPLTPVEPEETWSFVFGKVGEWRFHDHLAPYHTGVITVEESHE